MKLIEKNKNDTEVYQLDDGRLGAIYTSGYVRVTILSNGIRNGKYFHYDSTKNNKWYQINKVEKYRTNYILPPHYRRILISKRSDRLSWLQAFNAKNCDKVTQKIKMLEQYIKNLLYSYNKQAENHSLQVINLKDKIKEIEYIIDRK